MHCIHLHLFSLFNLLLKTIISTLLLYQCVLIYLYIHILFIIIFCKLVYILVKVFCRCKNVMSVQSRWIVRNFEFAKYWHITADISYFLMRSGNFYQSADYKDATVQPAASWALVTGFTFISSLRTQAGDTSRIHRLYCTSCNVTPVRVPW